MTTPTVMTGPGLLAFAALTVLMIAAHAAVVGMAAFGRYPLAAAARLADPVVRLDGAFREPIALVGAAPGAAAAMMMMHHGVPTALAGGTFGAAAAPVVRTASADQQGQRGDEDQRMDNSHGGPP